MYSDWAKRVAVVTGASSLIGEYVCRNLVEKGMYVFACGRNVQKIEDIPINIDKTTNPGKLNAWKCDLTDGSDIRQMYREIRKRYGRLDLCINLAMPKLDCSLLTGSPNNWRYLMEVGILGLCLNTQEAIKLMQLCEVDDAGHIIHMGSLLGHKIPSFQMPPEKKLIGSKLPEWFSFNKSMHWMVRALAECYRHELRASQSRIRVSIISPSTVIKEGPKYGTIPAPQKQRTRPFYNVQPEDVVQAVNYILDTPKQVNVNDILLETIWSTN